MIAVRHPARGLLAVAGLAFGVICGAVAAKAQAVAAKTTPPDQESIQIGISTDVIPVTSNFSGTHIAVFGTIENADRMSQILNEYAIVVVVRGPSEDLVVRRKERVLGIWVNRSARTYRNVPSFYALASNRAIEAVASPEVLREYQLGVDNIRLNLYSSGSNTFIGPAPAFANSLRDIRVRKGLFSQDFSAVDLLGSTLFRATVAIPSDVPIGRQEVTAYLFKNKQFVASRTGYFQVEKAGLEKMLFTLAHTYSLWYGIVAVLGALATGWLASMLFGGSRK